MREHLEKWHDLVALRDMSGLMELAHPGARFFSPMVFKPYEGREAMVFILSHVIQVFEDFTYHREFIDANARSAVLEFTATIGARSLKGVDIITFDENGLITEFEVLIRPMTGLQALAGEMAKRIGQLSQ